MIYCVEDDKNIRDLVVYTLNSTGLEGEGFPDARTFKDALLKKLPDLILLKLREGEVTKDIPVIMVTAKGAEFDKVQALDLGADDYVTKPFGMMELVSRIRAVLRRTRAKNQTTQEEILSIGPIRLDSARHEVTTDGKPVQLTLKEYELLRKMMENEGVVLTRDQLLVDIWGYDFDGETRTVDVHIRTLRTKLGDAGDLIETVRGVGYRIK
jgi:two-component system alkaline phosphatase synthesis response regulator PhoP